VFCILLTIYIINFLNNTINLYHVITVGYELLGPVWLMAGFCIEMLFKLQTFLVSFIMHVRRYSSRGHHFIWRLSFVISCHCSIVHVDGRLSELSDCQ
jgi:uncharacterized membrane protein YhaH (DUF805 family)